jgi:uncharacterized protein (TIGR03084 family)
VVELAQLIGDLEAEAELLDQHLWGLDASQWSRQTPARGWDVRDQVAHLCYFDEAAAVALAEPAALGALLGGISGAAGARADVAWARSLAPGALLERWRSARRTLTERLEQAGARGLTRVPWVGPDMSLASFATARLMEVWAHGVDVRDALGIPLDELASPRLRHVCHLGYLARPFSLSIHDRADFEVPVRLELVAPDGQLWSWGPEEAAERVLGPALDFALVVTQRRSLARTSLHVDGKAARSWLAVAQAFAGPATTTDPER